MVKNKKLNIAFLGGSYCSAVGRAHFSAINISNKFNLVAGCFSIVPKENKISSLEYGVAIDRTYGNLELLIAGEKNYIDAVVVLTPTNLHYEHVCRLIKAKIAVICEKSLCTSIQHANNIKKLLLKQGGFLTSTYNYCGYPMVREIKNHLKTNRIGKIHQINIQMPQQSFIKNNKSRTNSPQAWRLIDYEIPTLSLDLGIHIHSLIYFMIGSNATNVISSSNTYGKFKQIIDDIKVIAEFPDNITSSIWYSKSALGENNGLQLKIFGSQGAIHWVQESPDIFTLISDNGEKKIVTISDNEIKIANQSRYQRFKAGHPTGFIEAFANLYEDIHESLVSFKNKVKDENEYVFNIDYPINGLKLLDAINKSSINKKWVKV